MSLKILVIGKEPKNEDERKSYENIKSIIGECGHEVLGTPNDYGLENEFTEYENAFSNIKDADLIVCEATEGDIRQGMELREADLLGKPILVITKEGTEISALIAGLPLLQDVVYYEYPDHIRDGLIRTLIALENPEEVEE